MRRSLLTVVSILLIPFIAGCSAIPGLAPTPTATPPPPSATPVPPTPTLPPPTATLEPTAAPTALPTEVPDQARQLFYTPGGNLLVETTNRLLMFNGTDYSLVWQINACCDVLAVSDTLIVGASGNTLTGLNAANGETTFVVQEGEEANDTQTFFSAAISPDGETVATGEDMQIRLWNATTGEEQAAWPTGDEGVENQPNTSHVTNVAFRSDGLVLYSANEKSGKVFSWAMGSNGQLSTFELVNIIRYTFTPNANSIIAETIDYGFKAYDPRTGTLQREHPDIIGAAGYLSFVENGSQVVVWGYNTDEGNEAALWDVTTDTLLHRFLTQPDQPNWRSTAITPGGTTIALIDEQGTEIYFYNASTGERLSTITLP